MELSGGSLANNAGCCAESGGAQLPPPAGAALLVWLWFPLYLTVKRENLPSNFSDFLLDFNHETNAVQLFRCFESGFYEIQL